MIALDTNILVYSHRPESPLHAESLRCVQELYDSGKAWGIATHCLIEFAAIVSNPRIWKQPSDSSDIRLQIDAWTSSSYFQILGDDATVWKRCVELAAQGKINAGLWYDARIAAVCLAHGARELWTVDRDFSRFPRLRTRNPLLDSPAG